MLASNDQMVSGSEDGKLYIYDIVSSQVIAKLDHSPNKFVHSVSAHPTKNNLLLSCAANKVFVWRDTTEEED
jgi:WD40 repeat protein